MHEVPGNWGSCHQSQRRLLEAGQDQDTQTPTMWTKWKRPFKATTLPRHGNGTQEMWKTKPLLHVCRSKPAWTSNVHNIEEEEEASDEETSRAIYTIDRKAGKNSWYTSIKVNRHDITFKIDTGAQCNIISLETYNRPSKSFPTNHTPHLGATRSNYIGKHVSIVNTKPIHSCRI